MVIDKRDAKEVEYLAMPLEVIENGEISVPNIDVQEAEGLDGIMRNYVVVRWQDITPNMHTKKYDVKGHVVTAGCELSEAIKKKTVIFNVTAKVYIQFFTPSKSGWSSML